MGIVRILALDPGTESTGWAVLYCDDAHVYIEPHGHGVIRTKMADGTVRQRIDFIGNQVRLLVESYAIGFLVLEDFTEQGKFVGKTYKEMSWLIEHLRMVGRELEVPTDLFENGYWKKVLMNAQRVNKHQVQHYVSHRLPEAVELLKGQPDHVWDSVAIGLCKWKLLNS